MFRKFNLAVQTCSWFLYGVLRYTYLEISCCTASRSLPGKIAVRTNGGHWHQSSSIIPAIKTNGDRIPVHSAHWDDFPSKEIPDKTQWMSNSRKPCCKYFCHKRKKTDALQFGKYTILIFMYVIFLFIFLPPHTTSLGIFLKFIAWLTLSNE